MIVDPATRRANRWLFIALVIFAIGLCAGCLLWMRHRTVQIGGRVYPPAASTPLPAQLQNRLASFATYLALPISFQTL